MHATLRKTQAASVKPSLSLLQELVGGDLARVDALILKHVDNNIPLITEIARHLIASGGKRLRPCLVIACAKLCGYAGEHHVPLAAAIEFIHSATLLHDDVIDESELRRGLAAAHQVWGNKSSILVGDFLLSLAFQLMTECRSIPALKLLADTSGTIAEGEVMQLSTASDPATGSGRYLEIVTAKTASLFAAACGVGAIISARPPEQYEALKIFGRELGIAFQLTDDALDYVADPALLGKAIGDDFRDGKVTLPLILAYQRGNDEERRFWERSIRLREQQPGDLERAVALITRHDAARETAAIAQQHCARAWQALASFPEGAPKQALREAIEFCVQRGY